MEGAIYLLCAATALACCAFLLRGYRRGRFRLLLWCGLCFLALTLENVLLFIDLVILPEIDLSVYVASLGLAGVVLLVFGLVWENR